MIATKVRKQVDILISENQTLQILYYVRMYESIRVYGFTESEYYLE